jgi:cellulose synthase/poly-beta-1,6-N-acetylglucosamine synthase-like glycosyltransferase
VVHYIVFVAVIGGMGYGVIVYLLSRLGYYKRVDTGSAAVEEPPAEASGAQPLPSLVVLVPSYKEDPLTIHQTLVSAALQDYPNKRVVLLVDDPPTPGSDEDAELLASARRAPAEVMAYLQRPSRLAHDALARFQRTPRGAISVRAEIQRLRKSYREVGLWMVSAGRALKHDGHTSRFFGELVLIAHGESLIAAANDIELPSGNDRAARAAIDRHYRRLAERFDTNITTFERKRYVNLSHAANKAANLNSYIGLLGQELVEQSDHDGVLLRPAKPGETPALRYDDADYVITLDADSMVAHDYARRLVGVMESEGYERIAVAQTPYSAIPGAESLLERVAGATTDVQYIVHQGFTWLGSTFWVGANAVLRRTALEDIRGVEHERGFEVPVYAQDRTVIEDTESTIDLAARGWSLHNEPARLAYSATPPDFGALLIQRRRWANGGLLILPKMLRYAVHPAWARFGALELFVRTHYLASPAISSIALLLLITLPIGDDYLSPWLALAGIPYLALYGRDLVNAGYGKLDLARVFAFNWLLLPVNLSGVLKSVHQGITGRKIPFGRTPKVEGRTSAPAWAIACLWFLTAFVAVSTVRQVVDGQWFLLAYNLATLGALVYGLTQFIGWGAAWEDLDPWKAATTRWPLAVHYRVQRRRRVRRLAASWQRAASQPEMSFTSRSSLADGG